MGKMEIKWLVAFDDTDSINTKFLEGYVYNRKIATIFYNKNEDGYLAHLHDKITGINNLDITKKECQDYYNDFIKLIVKPHQ